MTDPLRMGPYEQTRLVEPARCHGCESKLRRHTLAWTDARAPGAIVCGRCVGQDRARDVPAPLPKRAERPAVLDGQASIFDVLDGDA